MNTIVCLHSITVWTTCTSTFSAFLLTSYCALHEKIVSVCLCKFCVSRKGGTGGGGWGHPQDAVHTVAARLGCKRAIGWGNSRPGYINRFSHAQGVDFGREGCLGSKQMFAN